MEKISINKLVVTAVLMALIIVAIFFIKIPIAGTGYVHIADSFILLSAFLGPLYGFLAGGVGTLLADVLAGYAVYAPWSLVVHGLQGLLMALAIRKMSNLDVKMFFILSFVISTVTVVLGYALAEFVISGSLAIAMATLLPNVLQVAIGSIIGAILFTPFQKILKLSNKG